MSDELRELYQELILDHNQHPRNFGVLESASHEAEGHNPLCGDRVVVQVRVEDGVVGDIAFSGAGCAISTASASVMTERLKGKPVAEAEEMFRQMIAFLTEEDDGPVRSEDADLGKLAAFGGVRDYPMRVKCATLVWHTLHAALESAGQPATTE